MFENAIADIESELQSAGEPIPRSDAIEAVEEGEMVAEGALNDSATTVEEDGTTYVVRIGNSPTYSLSDADADASDSAPAQTAQGGAESSSGGAEWADEEGDDLYDLNGLTVASDPSQHLVGEATGAQVREYLPDLVDGKSVVPNDPGSYMPLPVRGGRKSDEAVARILGEMGRPVLLEGDAGTGKNRLFDVLASEVGLGKYRVGFGSDVSVFDLVGEKDISGGESFYILGKIAKPAVFGGMTVLDEINMASGDTTSFVHGITEKPGNRSLELRGSGRTLRDLPVSDEDIERYGSWREAARAKWDPEAHLGRFIHPDLYVAATCNPVSYADTQLMNGAFRDRFVVIEHGYLTEHGEAQSPSNRDIGVTHEVGRGVQREAALLMEQTGIDEERANGLVEIAGLLREARRGGTHQTPITHRALEKTVGLAGPNEEFMPLYDAAHLVMVGQAQTPRDKEVIADALKDEV